MRSQAWAAALMLICAWADAAFAQVETPHITPTRLFMPPRIDGRLDDAAWRTAASIGNIPTPGQAHARRTAVKLAYDSDNLYVAWVCEEPQMANLVTGCCTRRDGAWGDDSVEVFVQPQPPEGSVFQIIVNGANVMADYRYDNGQIDRSWDSCARTAVGRVKHGWTVEMAIPWADLELASGVGPSMGLNLTRWQPIPGGVNSHWGHPGHMTNAEARFFGRMDGVQLDFKACSVEARSPRLIEGLYYRANRISVALRNRGRSPRSVRVEAESAYADGSPMLVPPARVAVELAAGEEREVALSVPVTEKQGAVWGRVRVYDDSTGMLLRQIARYHELPRQFLVALPARRYLYAGEPDLPVAVTALLGEDSLPLYRLRVTMPRADGTSTTRHVALSRRSATIPINVERLPLGDSQIEFALDSLATGRALQVTRAKVVRLIGPFDE